MKKEKELSSFEKLLLGIEIPVLPESLSPLRMDSLCPQCGVGKLAYNGLLHLECPHCGFINGEAGGCT